MKGRSRARVQASGRFVLRLDPGLHAALQRAAKEEQVSLNEYCSRKLAAPTGVVDSGPAFLLVQRAAEVHEADLIGVVAFGSWARGDLGTASDVDILIILESSRALTRSLYHAWDEQPLHWGQYAVEPHLVHLPEPGQPGTLWAEAAVDGIVLFDRQLRVSRRLASVRRDIAAGRLVRRLLHGQPYWAEVA
jgi:HicB family/Nucleotidyltransferase domain